MGIMKTFKNLFAIEVLPEETFSFENVEAPTISKETFSLEKTSVPYQTHKGELHLMVLADYDKQTIGARFKTYTDDLNQTLYVTTDGGVYRETESNWYEEIGMIIPPFKARRLAEQNPPVSYTDVSQTIKQQQKAHHKGKQKTSGVYPSSVQGGAPTSFSRGQRSEFLYTGEEEEEVQSIMKVVLEEYVGLLQQIPIVHKVHVLFDDRPNEVSIRVEYIENMLNLDRDILTDANDELTRITSLVRVEQCERIEITYIQKEVIV